MSNNYFRFKKFTVHQQNCAMKITTDACLLGASINLQNAPQNILDIGTGTGILSLMLAQKYPNAHITALEIDEPAYLQAKQNFEQSIFVNKIKAIHTNVNNFTNTSTFDFIISNPPYYFNDLQSPNVANNLAKHSTELSLNQLLQCIVRMACNKMHFSIILPYALLQTTLTLLSNYKLYINKILNIKHNIHKPISKIILHGNNFETHDYIFEELIIKNLDNTYTTNTHKLLEPYYETL